MTDYFRYINYNTNMTVESLSKKFGVPICMILNANNATNDLDFIDKKKIIMPYPCYCEQSQTCVMDLTSSNEHFDEGLSFDYNTHISEIQYTISHDVTIFDIAKKANVTASVIIRKNRLFSQSDIKIGKTLIIPVFDFETIIYLVQPCETLEGIAKKHNIDVGLIIKMNALNGIDSIYASMQLILPRNEN